MALDSAAAVATLRDLTGKFDNAVRAAEPFYPRICTVAPSNRKDEKYGWLGNSGGVREWVGDRQFARLRAATYFLANKKWEDSLSIEKDDLDDDTMGMYGALLENLAIEAAYHPDELVFNTLLAGASSACFDGLNFFDTSHSWGDSGTQSNKITVAGNADVGTTDGISKVTATEFRLAYHAARNSLLNFKRDNGKYFMRPTIGRLDNLLLVLPTALEKPAAEATKSVIIGNATNVVLDAPEIIASPYCTSAVTFWLFYLGAPLKPFVFQARKPLQRQMKGLNDREFKDVKFMTDARYNVGYLAWWNAVQVTLTT
jgi:phage major head subunit gpT-like protein